MTPALTKSLANLIVAVMTFLGWNTSDYSYLLPAPIKNEVTLVGTASTTERQQSATTNQNKTSDNKIQNKETPVSKSTPTQKKSTLNVVKTVPPTKTQIIEQKNSPTYYPAPLESASPVTNEIKNIVNQLVPPQTPTEIAEVKATISTEEKIKKSVVNIYCSRIIGNKIRKITGSGVVIDPSGVIITNAHVAEYFLLAQSGNNTDCFIRTGSPATSAYKAKLIYLPTAWVNANKNSLSLSTLTGTGENDYALLTITERVRKDAPNIPLTYLTTSNNYPTQNQNVFVAGYPAGFNDVKILDSALYELTKPTSINRLSSFTGSSADVINTGPTAVAEHGSSGGGVVDTNGALVALIAATTIDNTTGQKNIQAISLPYIKQSIKNYSGKSFESFVSNAQDEAYNFEKTTLPILANTLLGN